MGLGAPFCPSQLLRLAHIGLAQGAGQEATCSGGLEDWEGPAAFLPGCGSRGGREFRGSGQRLWTGTNLDLGPGSATGCWEL